MPLIEGKVKKQNKNLINYYYYNFLFRIIFRYKITIW